MIEIEEECTRFQTTSQRLADQVRTMIKKGWFSDIEIQQIHQKRNTEPKQDTNTITVTLNTEKQEHSKLIKIETPHSQTT